VKVYVKLYALLRKHHPGPNRSVPMEVDLPAGATVADLSPALNLPPELVRSAFINNQAAAPLTTVLQDGDRIGLFPPVVGGSGPARDKMAPAEGPRPYSLSG
jgi:molybdopterin synthase sulfur carrier subunit